MSVPLSTPNDEILQRGVGEEEEPTWREERLASSSIDILEWLEVTQTADFIRENGYKNVALQFSDDLLGCSFKVTSALRRNLTLEHQFFVLADTPYGTCCVDEVAAQHLNADVVVHYGHACLSPTRRLPVHYVFAGYPLSDPQKCVKELKEQQASNPSAQWALFWDVEADEGVSEVISLLKSQENTTFPICDLSDASKLIATGEVPSSSSSPSSSSPSSSSSCSSPSSCSPSPTCCGSSSSCLSTTSAAISPSPSSSSSPSSSIKSILGRDVPKTIADYFLEPKNFEENDKGDIEKGGVIAYIGHPDSCFFTCLAMKFNLCKFLVYDPTSSSPSWEYANLNVNRRLMKRYFRINQTRDADVIGIVAGTLGVSEYLETIEYLKKLIEEAGKRAYILAVGKLNPAKLANFQEVDVFVNVCCPESVMEVFDTAQEYQKPIVTPFEVGMALDFGSVWTGAYSVEFGESLNEQKDKEEKGEQEGEEEEDTYFSLLHGEMRSKNKKKEQEKRQKAQQEGEGGGEIMVSAGDEGKKVGLYTPGAGFLQTREYRGLEPKIGETAVEDAVAGLSGIAMSYEHELVDEGREKGPQNKRD